jgi:ParB/RepB/Spo0J family partition protein
MKPEKFKQTNTDLSNPKSKISNLVYLKYDISKIDIDTETSIRHEYDQDKLQELSESIRVNNNELIQPILISKIRDSGNYKVIAGRRRFLACRDILKLKTISAIVKNYDDDLSEFTAQFAENEERENWTDYDYVKAIQMIQAKKPGIKQEEIATVFNKTIDWTRKKMQHLNIVKDLDATSHLDKIPTSHITELTKLDQAERAEAIESLKDKAKKNELPTVKELRNLIEEKIEKSKLMTNVFFTYQHWKETGYIAKVDKKKVLEYMKDEIIDVRKKTNKAKKEYQEWEKYYSELNKDINLIMDEVLFKTPEEKLEDN